MEFLISLVITAVAIFAGAYVLPGVTVKNFTTALIVALLLALVNATLGALLNFITFGVLSFIVTVLMLMLVDKLVGGFEIKNFWWAVLLAIVVAILNWVIGEVVFGFD